MLASAQEKPDRTFDGSILEQRIDFAKFLLTQTCVPLVAIAADCGWESESAFAEVFECRVGVTPAQYRNWHQG